ncbi:dcp1-like decapping family protein [Ophiostoma piceae UAMH 11346]|uniref:Dcp1-like decapping family protein n=1 Tax=Ophiostoma piceae (strain UAMH 11346) TaxID=1262450 RepID=S3CPV7_OPHP1|nr:dcp1-like decapping family protein [Ophiostoma piceae UAMH 11346]
MSRQTPRKVKHQAQPSGGGGHRRQPSQPYSNHNMPVPPPDFNPSNVTIPDYNLRTLRRYEPSIESIEDVAVSAVFYAMDVSGNWVKPDPQIEGSLFLCHQQPLTVNGHYLPRACLFLFNRKETYNVLVDLATVKAAEETDGLMSMQIEMPPDSSTGAAGELFVLAFWIHRTPAIDDRVFDASVILRRWRAIRDALGGMFGTEEYSQTAEALQKAVANWHMKAGSKAVGAAAMVLPRQPTLKDTVDNVLKQTTGRGVVPGLQQ